MLYPLALIYMLMTHKVDEETRSLLSFIWIILLLWVRISIWAEARVKVDFRLTFVLRVKISTNAFIAFHSSFLYPDFFG
jgi:hypothetical protein